MLEKRKKAFKFLCSNNYLNTIIVGDTFWSKTKSAFISIVDFFSGARHTRIVNIFLFQVLTVFIILFGTVSGIKNILRQNAYNKANVGVYTNKVTFTSNNSVGQVGQLNLSKDKKTAYIPITFADNISSVVDDYHLLVFSDTGSTSYKNLKMNMILYPYGNQMILSVTNDKPFENDVEHYILVSQKAAPTLVKNKSDLDEIFAKTNNIDIKLNLGVNKNQGEIIKKNVNSYSNLYSKLFVQNLLKNKQKSEIDFNKKMNDDVKKYNESVLQLSNMGYKLPDNYKVNGFMTDFWSSYDKSNMLMANLLTYESEKNYTFDELISSLGFTSRKQIVDFYNSANSESAINQSQLDDSGNPTTASNTFYTKFQNTQGQQNFAPAYLKDNAGKTVDIGNNTSSNPVATQINLSDEVDGKQVQKILEDMTNEVTDFQNLNLQEYQSVLMPTINSLYMSTLADGTDGVKGLANSQVTKPYICKQSTMLVQGQDIQRDINKIWKKK